MPDEPCIPPVCSVCGCTKMAVPPCGSFEEFWWCPECCTLTFRRPDDDVRGAERSLLMNPFDEAALELFEAVRWKLRPTGPHRKPPGLSDEEYGRHVGCVGRERDARYTAALRRFIPLAHKELLVATAGDAKLEYHEVIDTDCKEVP